MNKNNKDISKLVPGHWFQSFAGNQFIKLGSKQAKKKFSKKPIIIGACPRSGTTLLLAVLGAHPNIFAIPDQTYAFNEWTKLTDKEGSENYVPRRMDRLFRTFIKYRIPITKNRWCEKTPVHIQSFKKILNYYGENVLLINMFRDGRDIVTSKHPKHNSDKYWVSNERWINDVSIGIELDNHPQVLNIRYEDLINNFESSITRIYNYLDEQVPDRIEDWVGNTNIKYSKHWGRSVKEFHSNSIGRWKKNEHRQRVEHFMKNNDAVQLLEKLGYLNNSHL